MTAYELFYISSISNFNIIGYVSNFVLERELEKLLDKLTFTVSRSIDNNTNFEGFNPNIEIYLKFNGTGIFRGRIKSSNKKNYYEIVVYSSAEILDRIIVQKVYENTTPEAIFNDLINTYTDLTPVSESSGSTIERFFADDYISSIIQKLNAALGWSLYTNSSKSIYFRPRGTITNANTIYRQSTTGNAILGKWKKDYNEMCNDIRVLGDNISYDTQESFVGDGTKVEFILAQQPISIRITIAGDEVSPIDYDVNSETNTIIFDTAPLNATAIIIYYAYAYPIYVVRQNNGSIGAYGRFTKLFIHKWLKTRTDITTYCNNYIKSYKDPLLSNNIQMNPSYITVFTPGEQVRIIDDLENYDDNYTINRIKLEYTKGVVELNVGSYIPIFINLQNQMQDRIKELEKSLSKQYIQLYSSHSETLSPSETLDISDINNVNLKVQVTYPPKCDYGRGTLYDARVGLCEV